jgi:DNA-binding transcriptional MerR regulator
MVPPKKLYKIGEVIKYSGFNRQTIHNYTMLGLIREAERTEKGHRLYDEAVFERLEKIRMFKRHRPLVQVKELLDKLDQESSKSADKS